MNRKKYYEKERLKSVHLAILIVMSASLFGVGVYAPIMDWEMWELPFLFLGTMAAWTLHVRQRMTEEQRLWIYTVIVWAIIIYHGVHPSSVFDITPIVILEFALFAQTDDKRIIRIGLGLYVFCVLWQAYLVFVTKEVQLEFNALYLSRIALHLFAAGFSYWLAERIIIKRRTDLSSDELEIRELERSQKRTEDFLANVSHELRTPINAVTGVGSIMMQQAKDAEKKERAEQVFRAGRRLSEQITDMLDYTEIDSGKLSLSEEEYMISSVLNDVVTDLELYDREELPDVLLDVRADLPVKLFGDVRFVKKILRQVTENAIKFTRKGGVLVSLYADKRDYGINLNIDVQDTGIGMRAAELERIRTTSYQADADRARRTGGLGLGFPILNGLVYRMGGFCSISSVPGEGTRVHISIPQQVADPGRCMQIRQPEKILVAFYQDPLKFPVPAVRDFYTQMIFHIISDFRLTMKRVTTQEDLRQMMETQSFSHLFTADEEYSRDPAFYDVLCDRTHVIVVAKNSFRPSPGSRVTVLWKPLYAFPLVDLLNAESAEEARRVLQKEAPVSFAGLRALVVDDESMNLMVAQRMFGAYGMEVTCCSGGEEAVRKAFTERFDVIFMDHMMPGMNGVEATSRIRVMEKEKNVRNIIIALTANAVSGAKEMYLSEGFDAFIAKPVERQELERVLQRVLEDAKSGGRG
ncbi:MAG: response regulator [Lachnospiraceae bacterium]|nr:response regulator [Lachnospiraceae bacterium]